MRPAALVRGATAYFKRCAKPIDLKLGQALQFMLVELATEKIEHTIRTAHNKRFSEMAVGVETGSLLLPMTLCGSSGCGASNPPLRQAAGRYLPFTLLQCVFLTIHGKCLNLSKSR